MSVPSLETLSFGYAALAAGLLFLTVGAYAPRVFGSRFAPVLGGGAMVLTYFVPQVVAIGVLVAIALDHAGVFALPLAQLGLVVHVACWVALAAMLVLVHHAHPLLDGVVVRDSDQPFCEGITDEERRLIPPGRVTWLPTLTLRIEARARSEVVRSVVFHEVAGVRLRLDVYRPRARGEARPALVYIHGGGWMMGTRRQSRFMMHELAAAGWTAFAISYRFAPRHPLPAALEDCKAAVAWVRAHAAEYGASGERVFVMGGSAGGHLAAMVALTPNEARFQPGFESADTSVQGAVVLYGVSDVTGAFEERPHPALALLLERIALRRRFRDGAEHFRAMDPHTWIRADAAPPILVVHGRSDAIVPIEQSHRFVERLRAAGADAHLLEMPFAHHAFEVFPSPLHQRAVRVILRFLESVRRAPAKACAAPSTPSA